MKVIMFEGAKVPVKSWCNDIEEGANLQINNLCKLPFVFHHVAIAPDCHQGYGMPIGGILATKNVIIPNAVGVDIGCGMSAFNTGIKDFTVNNLKSILGKIRKTIPVGMNRHNNQCHSDEMPDVAIVHTNSVVMREYNKARCSLGTLGSGNHFLELQKDEDGNLWVMIHSGSRNLGKQVADHYNKIAIDLNEKYFSSVPKEWQLAFLPIDTAEAQMYFNEMTYCLQFAFANRKKMMYEILDIIRDVMLEDQGADFDGMEFSQSCITNIHHNYASLENHFGQNVCVHRKGATQAKLGQIGIIPGSQGTKSYIVEGLGNAESFMSCSHGAGRKMSRKMAHKNLNFEDEKKKLDDQGILHGIRNKDDLDEASGAYKNIDDVMALQTDLIKIIHTLQPLAVVKG